MERLDAWHEQCKTCMYLYVSACWHPQHITYEHNRTRSNINSNMKSWFIGARYSKEKTGSPVSENDIWLCYPQDE